MHPDVASVLLDEATIAAKVREMAARISADYRAQDLMVVGILKGGTIFCADLLRCITVNCTLDFMAISSYGAASKSTGVHRINLDLEGPLLGRNVLLVEDIVDTGLTLRFLKEYLMQRNPASLRVAVLLDKPSRRQVDVQVDYKGFEIPDEFVVGYGLDFASKYRNLPDICILKSEIYSGK